MAGGDSRPRLAPVACRGPRSHSGPFLLPITRVLDRFSRFVEEYFFVHECIGKQLFFKKKTVARPLPASRGAGIEPLADPLRPLSARGPCSALRTPRPHLLHSCRRACNRAKGAGHTLSCAQYLRKKALCPSGLFFSKSLVLVFLKRPPRVSQRLFMCLF